MRITGFKIPEQGDRVGRGRREPVHPACFPRPLAVESCSDAWLDNETRALSAWLFQNVFHTRARWRKRTAIGKAKAPFCGASAEAL
jgi:hypothetical protein